jgi:hypothetical protein
VYDDAGQDISTTDGLWIIALGMRGIVGLAALLGILTLPVALALARWRGDLLMRPELAALQICLVVVCLAAVNDLPNADFDPVIMLMAGGIASTAALKQAIPSAAPRRAGSVVGAFAQPSDVQAFHG